MRLQCISRQSRKQNKRLKWCLRSMVQINTNGQKHAWKYCEKVLWCGGHFLKKDKSLTLQNVWEYIKWCRRAASQNNKNHGASQHHIFAALWPRLKKWRACYFKQHLAHQSYRYSAATDLCTTGNNTEQPSNCNSSNTVAKCFNVSSFIFWINAHIQWSISKLQFFLCYKPKMNIFIFSVIKTIGYFC